MVCGAADHEARCCVAFEHAGLADGIPPYDPPVRGDHTSEKHKDQLLISAMSSDVRN